MQQLIYARAWNKNTKKTWSGTAFNLKRSLEKYFQIIDCKMKQYCIWDYFMKFRLVKRDCELRKIRTNRKKFTSFTKKNIPIFQFDETFLKTPSFLYIDLCVEFLCNLAESNQKAFSYSGFQKIPLDNLRKRAIEQNMYIRDYCTQVFTMGKWLKEYMVKTLSFSESKITAVGGGINVDCTKIDYSQKTGNKILFIGRDFKRKGGYVVVEAFKKLKKEKPNVELYIIGPSSNPINEDIDGIHYLGDISSDMLYYYYNLCDIFCMPSYFEAYGLVFIEALTFGLPCIGRNSFEMPYLIQENETGYLLNEDDDEILKKLMKNCLENKIMQNFVKEKREYYINEYSWDKVAKRCMTRIKN